MNYRQLRHIAQQASIIGMEASCFAALVYFFGVGDGQVPIFAFLLIGWGLMAFNRWLVGLAVWDTLQGKLYSLISGLIGVSLLMGLTSNEVGFAAGPITMLRALADLPLFFSGQAPLTAALLGGGMLYYRVLVTVREPIGIMGIARRVVTALAVFIWVVFLMDVQRGYVSWEVVLVFGAFTLLAFILTRTHELDMIPGVAPLPVTPRWTGNIAAIIGVTLAGGFLLQTISVDPLSRVGGLLQSIWNVLIIILAFPLRLLLMLLEPVIQGIISQLDVEVPTIPTQPGFEGQADPIQVNSGDWSVEWLQIVAGVAAVIFIVAIFNQAFRRFREGGLNAFMPKVNNQPTTPGSWFPFSFRNPFGRRAPFGVETVRDLYKNVLVFGENQGIARAEDDTPYEYLVPLASKYPAVEREFQALTDAYVATHYGEITFTRDEIRRLQAAWEKLKALPTV